MSTSSTSRERHPPGCFAPRWLFAALAAACFAPRLIALDPNRALAQYIHNSWGAEQGFPGGAVSAFAATSDGYLWIGADKGLVQFDGVSFRLFNHSNTPAFPTNHVLGLTSDREGALWVRLQTPDLLRLRGGVFKQEFPGETLETGVTTMGPGIRGDVLLARPRDLLRYSDGRFTHLAPGVGYQARPWISIAETSDGTVWIGTRDEGLLALRNGAVSEPARLPDRKVNCLLSGKGSELWIGTDNGLAHWDGREISAGSVPEPLRHAQVLALIRDHDSNLWVGTATGLVRINAHGAASTNRPEGRRAGPVDALFEDRERNLWAGGPDGIERYRDSAFLNYPSEARDSSQDSGPLYVDAAGRTWFAPSGGGLHWLNESGRGVVREAGLDADVVYSIDGGPGELWLGRQRGGLTHLLERSGSFFAKTYTSADGLAPGAVYAVHRSRDGTVWAGTLNGGVSRLGNGRITTYTTANGLASNTISAVEEGVDGTVWFATPNGLQSFSRDRWRVYSSQDGMPPGRVNCLKRDAAGVLWLGTGAGLAFIRGTRVETPRDPPEALLEEILGIENDGRGSLWIATSGHVVRAPRANLLGDAAGRGDAREFGPEDGLLAGGVKRQRSVVADGLRRIWLSLHGGISVVDPARTAAESVPAMVHIRSMSADARPLLLGVPMRIPVGPQRIILSFIGVSLSAPDRVRYRYRLDPFDRDWSEPTAARDAVFTNLSPGSYRFRVVASNSEGVWNSSEAAIAMEITPATWQTWWFRSVVALAFLFGIIAIYRLRLRRLTARLNLRFQERLAERTRIAQELHDTLLQGFLSASMQVHVAANALSADSPAKPTLTRALALMRQVIEEGRGAVQGLRSTDSVASDLHHAFSKIQQDLILQQHDGKPVDFRVIVEGERRPLRPALQDEVYRIGREALINAFRHARAKKIEVEIKYSSSLRIFVRDDGCGIDPEIVRSGRDRHWGLSGMRERADRIGARLHIMTSASAGTEIELAIPGNLAFQKDSNRKRKLAEEPIQQPAEGQKSNSKKAGA